MGLIFSRQCEYAIQAVLYLALREDGQWASIKEITAHLKSPTPFLAKILQRLRKKRILKSFKGPTGGFALAKPAEKIKLLDVVMAIDGSDLFEKCAMGFPECSPANPCAIHEHWGRLRDNLHRVLTARSVVDVAREMRRTEYRG
jgi:Rrf2 family iron-sulfur cluster assembly transcriptional regulator